jgi:flagellar biosynthetic protein FliP
MTLNHDLWHLSSPPRRPRIAGMTTSTCSTTHTRSATRKNLRFTLHFAEMVVAMLVGMAALGPIWSLAWPGLSDLPVVDTLVMATNMTIGMGLWMRIRRHSWRLIAEMSIAMYAPFFVLMVPYALGAVSAGTLMMGGHLLMLPAMLIAMLLRHHEYRH